MADIRIKELTELTELTDNDYFVVDNSASGGETKKYRATRVTEMIDAVAEEIEEKMTPSIDTALAVGSASGDIASFSDGSNLPMPKLQVGIEPQQDLHGYDSPWVGGAGKNKLPIDSLSISGGGITAIIDRDSNNNVVSVTVNGTASGTVYVILNTFTLPSGTYTMSGCPSNGGTDSYRLYDDKHTSWADDGSGASFTLSEASQVAPTIRIANGYTTNNLKFYPMIESGSEKTTFAPYSNICPISGWDEVNVGVSGKNLIPYVELGILNQTDGSEEDNYDNKRTGFIRTLPNTQYTISGLNGSGVSIRIFEYKKNKTYIRNYVSSNITNSVTIQTGAEVGYIRFQGNKNIFTSNVAQCEKGTTATTYEPYNGHTYTLDLDGTRYGGKLDVVSGVMTITHGYVDLGSINWTYQATNKVFYTIRISDYLFNSSVSAICSQYGYIGTVGGGTASLRDDEYNGKCAFYYLSTGVSREFYIKDLAYDDATAFKTAMNGVQLVYELATPLTIQLTPTQVKSLLGQNNVWCDTGEIIDCEYKRDATAIINSLIARIEALENQ